MGAHEPWAPPLRAAQLEGAVRALTAMRAHSHPPHVRTAAAAAPQCAQGAAALHATLLARRLLRRRLRRLLHAGTLALACAKPEPPPATVTPTHTLTRDRTLTQNANAYMHTRALPRL
eukprot:2692474-Prymnesium_polylepis.2